MPHPHYDVSVMVAPHVAESIAGMGFRALLIVDDESEPLPGVFILPEMAVEEDEPSSPAWVWLEHERSIPAGTSVRITLGERHDPMDLISAEDAAPQAAITLEGTIVKDWNQHG